MKPKTIRDARIAKKMTQAELAQAMGVSKSAISLWEKGTRMVGAPEQVKRLSEILGLPRKRIRPDWYDAA